MIESLYNEWRLLQPMKNEDQIRLDQKFMLEFNYNSNHLEGNTLTYGQTEFLLMFGTVVDNASMKDLEDMKASNVALQKVKVEAEDRERPLTESFIRELHHTLLREDYEESRRGSDGIIHTYTVHAGVYKTRPNSVETKTGEIFLYASPEETPALMTDLVRWYNEEERKKDLTPIELASLFHYRYIRIHPFEDGNGRVSRLLVNYILHRQGYPMIVVKSDDKDNYLSALNRCDVGVGPVPSAGAQASIKQIEPFVIYMSNCLERALAISIKAAKGESIEEEKDYEKQLVILERNARRDNHKDAHMVTPQDKIDVYNKFHRDLALRLKKLLEPASKFFITYNFFYYFTKRKDSLLGDGFIRLDPNKALTMNMPKMDFDVLNDAVTLLLLATLKDIKIIYKMKDLTIQLNASVFFESTHYVFNDKAYQYGSYPSKHEIDIYIDSIKEEVLKKISQSMEEKD